MTRPDLSMTRCEKCGDPATGYASVNPWANGQTGSVYEARCDAHNPSGKGVPAPAPSTDLASEARKVLASYSVKWTSAYPDGSGRRYSMCYAGDGDSLDEAGWLALSNALNALRKSR